MVRIPFALPVLSVLLSACGTSARLAELERSEASVPVGIPDDILPEELEFRVPEDTMKALDARGREILIMRAVEGEDGEFEASQAIVPAVVRASFRNAAERNGFVDLCFDITVPRSMMDSRWQLRLVPTLTASGEERRLDSILVTGGRYREEQLEGYRKYRRYLDGIITDSLAFIRDRELRVFMDRNGTFPYDRAREHYTYHLAARLNDLREAGAERAFRRMVPAPIVTEGIRLDTLVSEGTDEIHYQYVQTIRAEPRMRRAVITLEASIYRRDREIYRAPPSDSLSFYISSLSGLADYSLSGDEPLYRAGLDALRNLDYALAISLLKPYADFNTALSYAALNYDATSMEVLRKSGGGARADYLKAILYSRMGDERSAVESYLRACESEPSFIHRGNLDPEISTIIKKYRLKKHQDNETYDY